MERGLDISHAQSPTNSALLALLAQPLYTFVIVKATEGLRLDIAVYPAHRANNTKFKKRHGAYHFAWPSQDPIGEAQHFVSYAALLPGEIGCLDLENWGKRDANGVWLDMVGVSWATRIDYALKWSREFTRLTGAVPVWYMNWDWIKNFRANATVAQWNEMCAYPLWLADYDSNLPGVFPAVNPKVAGGPTFTVWLHQWTASKPANDGGLDGDALMEPSKWNTYAIPEDEMSAADVAAILAAVAAVDKKVDTLANKVDQKANIVDVKAVSATLTTVQQQMSSISNGVSSAQGRQEDLIVKVGEVNANVGLAEAEIAARVESVKDGLDASVTAAVKETLTGFSVHTTMQFPTN
jgi:GH25 family lysozyme M1 (1,4-beta-N-acetylmuramidase)